MRDPRRVSSQTWLESTELLTIWSHGMTGDGGWNTSVFAMAAPIPYDAALMAVRVGSSSPANRYRYDRSACAVVASVRMCRKFVSPRPAALVKQSLESWG